MAYRPPIHVHLCSLKCAKNIKTQTYVLILLRSVYTHENVPQRVPKGQHQRSGLPLSNRQQKLFPRHTRPSLHVTSNPSTPLPISSTSRGCDILFTERSANLEDTLTPSVEESVRRFDAVTARIVVKKVIQRMVVLFFEWTGPKKQETMQALVSEYEYDRAQRFPDQAFAISNSAVQRWNHEPSRLFRGLCLLHGFGGASRNPEAAYRDFSDCTSVVAQECRAWCEIHGVGVPQDIRKGIQGLLQLGKRGAVACLYLAIGYHFQRSPYYENLWLLRAAHRGHPEAMTAVAHKYLEVGDIAKARRMFCQAAQRGHLYATYQFAKLCRDPITSLQILVCLPMIAEAQVYLAERLIYQYQDGYSAYKVLKPWLRRQHPEAFYLMGVCAEKKLGPRVGPIFRFYFYSKSASLGHSKGLQACAICYLRGIGTNVNIPKGLDMLCQGM